MGPKGPTVAMLPAPVVSVPGGRPGEVQLNFRVVRGYHVNSNKPKAEFLIPTALKLDAPTDIVIGKISYPPGQEMSFPFSPDEKLSVYSGDFLVGVVVRPLHTVIPGKYMLRIFGDQLSDEQRARTFPVTIGQGPVSLAMR